MEFPKTTILPGMVWDFVEFTRERVALEETVCRGF
jgi:hypothetical protein